MRQFRIQHAPPYEQTGQSIPLTDRYFTVDTAERATLEGWKRKNPHNLTYAFDGDAFMGFVEILPVTAACGALLAANDLLEEELTADAILPPETMEYAQYLYISGIAIADTDSYRSKQAAAALVSCGAGMIRHLYRPDRLKTIFANPTTWWGNRIIGRFGLHPLSGKKRSIRAGNDIYAVAATPEYWDTLAALEKRYQRFILNYPWPLA